jgi:hypothetical protein
MEAAYHDSGFSGGFQDIGRIGAAAVHNAPALLPFYLGNNSGYSAIGGSNESEFCGIDYLLAVFHYAATVYFFSQLLGRRPTPTVNARYIITLVV